MKLEVKNTITVRGKDKELATHFISIFSTYSANDFSKSRFYLLKEYME